VAFAIRCDTVDITQQEEFFTMNKTKRVAWHKRLKKSRKRDEKARAARGVTAAAPQRPSVPRR
jgi:hypothetical protein